MRIAYLSSQSDTSKYIAPKNIPFKQNSNQENRVQRGSLGRFTIVINLNWSIKSEVDTKFIANNVVRRN